MELRRFGGTQKCRRSLRRQGNGGARVARTGGKEDGVKGLYRGSVLLWAQRGSWSPSPFEGYPVVTEVRGTEAVRGIKKFSLIWGSVNLGEWACGVIVNSEGGLPLAD